MKKQQSRVFVSTFFILNIFSLLLGSELQAGREGHGFLPGAFVCFGSSQGDLSKSVSFQFQNEQIHSAILKSGQNPVATFTCFDRSPEIPLSPELMETVHCWSHGKPDLILRLQESSTQMAQVDIFRRESKGVPVFIETLFCRSN